MEIDRDCWHGRNLEEDSGVGDDGVALTAEGGRIGFVEINEADCSRQEDGEKFVRLLDSYCRTSAGGGAGLAEEVGKRLLDELPRYRNAIAFLSSEQEELTGVILGSYNLYVFSGRPSANVQFLFVRPEHQRRGIARHLVLAFENKARALGCCKVSLEVREHNESARALYGSLAYRRATFGPQDDILEFWEKKLP